MAKEGKTSWRLDLDIKQFTANSIKAKGLVESIGDAKGFTNLTRNILSAGRALAIVGTAVVAFKTGLAAVMAAEKAAALNDQFNLLAKNVGLVGSELSTKVVDAMKGLADDKEAIMASAEAIGKLGANAAKLPEIMELARKRTAVFGGELIANYTEIANAIAAGNVRALKNVGIVVDQGKALREYAQANGQAVSTLSQEQKQRAILNATLEKGKTIYAGINEETKSVTMGWQRLGTTLGRVSGDIFEWFGGKLKPLFDRITTNLNVMAEASEKFFKGMIGSEADQAKAELEDVYSRLRNLRTQLLEMRMAAKEENQGIISRIFGGPDERDFARVEGQIKQLEAMRDELQKKAQAVEPEKAPIGAGTEGEPGKDYDLIRQQETKFQSDLLKMKESRLQAEIALSTAYIDENNQLVIGGEQKLQEQIALMKEQERARINEIMASDALNKSQKEQLIKETEAMAHLERIRMEEELDQIRQRSLDNWVDKSTSASDGVARAFIAGAAQQKKALTDWGATGRTVFNSFSNNATQALLAFGSGAMSAQEAMRALTFGVIADTAEAKGKEMLLASIWPPNPAGMAGGAGLIALSGFLRSKAGAAPGGGIPGIGGGAGGAIAEPTLPKPEVEEMQKKAVSITVQGSYFETEQTQRRLVEMIRSESDATDFRFRQIGG